jgi:hypothetical protein
MSAAIATMVHLEVGVGHFKDDVGVFSFPPSADTSVERF